MSLLKQDLSIFSGVTLEKKKHFKSHIWFHLFLQKQNIDYCDRINFYFCKHKNKMCDLKQKPN